MITTLFRTAATPLAVFLDHVMVPRRTFEFFDLSEELSCDLNSDHGIEVAI
ncbi:MULTISPECIES: hypothetical protein [unclassified Rhodococcus (in: high G+C Gram-positive bacteria)]|uniref:hypothetical protein n=1 Tax=unclassified Rhodococcus (in: high G+C Gram-positive bacteria) TaxID=192944 RepID=UPI000A83572E|nr:MULTISPECIES: hypothetical protein [unclassified Rhodococcus (in: high G+C Gram-positive bacteria)]